MTVRLPYSSPPLRSNDRSGWRKAAADKAKVRRAGAWCGVRARNAHGGPITYPVVVTLVWEVTTRQRRDVGASSPTLKAALDGLVDCGLLPDDHHGIVTEERLRIEHGRAPGVRIDISPAT